MTPQNLPALTKGWLLPVAATVLALSIFVIDTFTDLELAVPAFYTAVVLMSVRFCKKREVILVGLGCIALTLLSDFLTSETATTEAGIINTGISLLAIATTTYLALKIEAECAAAFEARSQLAHVGRVTALGELTTASNSAPASITRSGTNRRNSPAASTSSSCSRPARTAQTTATISRPANPIAPAATTRPAAEIHLRRAATGRSAT